MSPRHRPVEFTPPVLEDLEKQREKFKNAELAPLTVKSYDRDWRVFCAWCEAAGRESLPATTETVELYATDMISRGRKVTTVVRHRSGITYMHRKAGFPNPCGPELARLLRGARRTLCEMPNSKDAMSVEDLRRIVEKIGDRTAIAARNRALLLLGFGSALRRSNLARLRFEDIAFDKRGLLLTIRHEKQDRKGEPRVIAVPAGKHRATCPVRAVRRWLQFRGEDPGPLFCRSTNGVPNGKTLLTNRIGQIVQESVALINLDPKRYGAHSLRAGYCTEGLERGANEVAIAHQTGHHSLDTLKRYERSRNPFRLCASVGL